MNKAERVRAALGGGAVDRPPVCLWHHFGDIGPEATVAAHVRFFRESGVDLVKMMCDEFFEYPLGGASTASELLKLKPQGAQSHYVRGQVERAGQITEALHGEAPTLYNAFSPYATLKHALGDDNSMALIREHEDAAVHAMAVIAEDTCAMIEGILRESGAMGMMLPLQGAEEGRFTAEEYARLIAPFDRQVIDTANALSDVNLLHFCGWDGVRNHLEWWDVYPGRMVNWAVNVEGVDLRQGRERFPGRVLMGGFDNRPGTLLDTGTEEEVKAFTRQLVRDAGDRSLFIGADCSVPADIDHRRLHWIIEALEDGQ